MRTISCEYELDFLCEILKKCHIRTTMLSLHDPTDAMLDAWIDTIVGARSAKNQTIQQALGNIADNTKYTFVNELQLRYVFMRLPLLSEKNLLFIGPFLSSPLSSVEVLEIGEELGLAPSMQKMLLEYYATLPLLTESDHLATVIDTFCERVWQTSTFAMAEIDRRNTFVIAPTDSAADSGTEEALANLKQMEMRYAFENELLQAVALGQQHKEKLLLSAINEHMFERRLQDPVRNAKNYCIIMNTLLRKAAEYGGVHPLYIDRTSSAFATQIERITSLDAVPALMREMFSTYCRCVRNHTTKQYSAVVKKTILIIDADISAELSLGTLAEQLDLSAGYLATVFKRETGKTVLEYIRERRINHAVHLLNTTNLQIQTIAMHCGIMDVQYFSKLFKKQMGKTPKEYRDALRR